MDKRRSGFTLVELLITVAIIGIMAAMVVFAMFGAQEAAKQRKTEALITRIDAILKYKWESYRTRRVNITAPADMQPQDSARVRLDALHDLIRLEMPDRWSDVYDPPKPWGYQYRNTSGANVTVAGLQIPRPAASVAFERTYNANMTRSGAPTPEVARTYQGAECLYMILRSQIQEDGDDISIILKPENTGDKDNDGFPEILDAWGTPINFIRWAPGFISELQVAANGTISSDQPDPPKPTPPTNPPTAIFDALVDYGTNNVPYGEVISRGLSTTDSAYVGGAIIMLNPSTRVPEFDKMARITGYQYFPLQTSPSFRPGFARFTVATRKDSAMQPFTPGGGGTSGAFIVLPPDPFDPRHVYPVYPNTASIVNPDLSVPTFDLYPLVFSAGADKSSGIVGDSPTPLRYSTENVNPFFRPTNYKMLGYQESDGTWKDNIHNHMMGLR